MTNQPQPADQQHQNFFRWLTTPPDSVVVKKDIKESNDGSEDGLVIIIKTFIITEVEHEKKKDYPVAATTTTELSLDIDTNIDVDDPESKDDVFALQHPSHIPTPKTINTFDLSEVQKGIEDELLKLKKSALSLLKIPLSDNQNSPSLHQNKRQPKYVPSPETPPESPVLDKKNVLNKLSTCWGPNFWKESNIALPTRLGSNHRQTIVAAAAAQEEENFNCSSTMTTMSSSSYGESFDDATHTDEPSNDKESKQQKLVKNSTVGNRDTGDTKTKPPTSCPKKAAPEERLRKSKTATPLQKQWVCDINNNLHQYYTRPSIRLLDHDDIPPSIEFYVTTNTEQDGQE
jgi:hypothetical protein